MYGAGGLPAILGGGKSASYPAIAWAGSLFAVAWTEQTDEGSVIRVAVQ